MNQKFREIVYCIVSNHKTTIWKPPESVSIALGQFINLWRPPNSSISSDVGRSARWYVFPRIIWQPISSSWLVVNPFIVPATRRPTMPSSHYDFIHQRHKSSALKHAVSVWPYWVLQAFKEHYAILFLANTWTQVKVVLHS